MKKTFTLLLSIFIFSYLAKGEEEYIMLIGSTLADSSVEKIITAFLWKISDWCISMVHQFLFYVYRKQAHY